VISRYSLCGTVARYTFRVYDVTFVCFVDEEAEPAMEDAGAAQKAKAPQLVAA